jgi:hypothetical protein
MYLSQSTFDDSESIPNPNNTTLNYEAVFSCCNLLDINLDGATFSLWIFSGIAENYPHIQSISVHGVTDPDDGASLEILEGCYKLRTLNISSWFELSDSSVVTLIPRSVSLCSMFISYCRCLRAEATCSNTTGISVSIPFGFPVLAIVPASGEKMRHVSP